jgi:hypothetical protein
MDDEARAGRGLRDARAHEPRADDPDLADLTHDWA